MSDRRGLPTGGQSYLENRRRATNEISNANQDRTRALQQYQQQKDSFNKEREANQAPPKFKKTRTMMLFRGQYLIVTLSFVLLLINSVLRGFTGTWWYLLPALVFTVLFVLFSSYFNPLDYASDTEKYVRPKLDRVYLQLQDTLKILLTLMGTNLDRKPQGTWRMTFSLVLTGTIFGILFYNSGFAFLGLPFLVLYIIRSFAAGTTKEAGANLQLLKWTLFVCLLANTVLSAYWRTPFSFELFLWISFLNTLQVWLKNTELYGIEVITRLKQEEERRKAEVARRAEEERIKRLAGG